MKKSICILLTILLAFSLFACDTEESNSEPVEESKKIITSYSESQKKSIDVDLTKLSSTMVYSEVYNMMSHPKDYLGKTIKMEGKFSLYHDEANDKYYYACIIADATACCSQGLEFVLAGAYQSPEDYPVPGSMITVEGEFSTYREGQYLYCHLIDAALV